MSSYLCHWQKLGSDFEMKLMKLVERPEVKVKGRTFQAGMEKLSDAIRKTTMIGNQTCHSGRLNRLRQRSSIWWATGLC